MGAGVKLGIAAVLTPIIRNHHVPSAAVGAAEASYEQLRAPPPPRCARLHVHTPPLKADLKVLLPAPTEPYRQ